jgi:hypothetical protein
MDNRVDLPGYKYYVDPLTGSRPDVLVAFLSISPTIGGRVNGRLVEVSGGELDELDRRERNYSRVDVSAAVQPAVDGVVWAYIGRPAAVERLERGLASGRVVIPDHYYADVRRGFAAGGRGVLEEFDELTVPPAAPIVGLRRVDLPGERAGRGDAVV